MIHASHGDVTGPPKGNAHAGNDSSTDVKRSDDRLDLRQIALGYTMVYGVLRMINFAHGEMFMLVPTRFPGPCRAGWRGRGAGAFALTIAFFAAVIGIGFVGVGIERLAYKPLRNSTRLAPMLSSLGVSLSLVTGVQIMAGPQPVAFPNFPGHALSVTGGHDHLGANRHPDRRLRSHVRALPARQPQQDRHHRARRVRKPADGTAFGINVNLAISMVFFTGPLLGAAGGILYASYYGIMTRPWAR